MKSVPPSGQISCREVEDADDQRREEHAGEAAQAADRDHDQEEHQVLEREVRDEAEEVGAEAAAERRHAAAEREGEREQRGRR